MPRFPWFPVFVALVGLVLPTVLMVVTFDGFDDFAVLLVLWQAMPFLVVSLLMRDSRAGLAAAVVGLAMAIVGTVAAFRILDLGESATDWNNSPPPMSRAASC